MDREDIIRLAREVGYPLVEYEGTPYIPPLLEVLLETVRADERERIYFQTSSDFVKAAIADEREACAKIVEESGLPDSYSEECLPEIADVIRARGQA